MTGLLIGLAVLELVALGLTVALYLRGSGDALTRADLEALEKRQEQLREALLSELGRNRQENAQESARMREELAQSMRVLGDSFVAKQTEIAGLQNQHLSNFGASQVRQAEAAQAAALALRTEVGERLSQFSDVVSRRMTELSTTQTQQNDSFKAQLDKLTLSNETKAEALRVAVDARLKALQEENSKKLDEMRHTVDEKLQGTLEKRLGESFKLVSDRLEQVHKGLGEMQTLANGVGDLKKVLTNVKTRGTWGEIQLGNLLEQILTLQQYDSNVITKLGSAERVEFAIKLPGKEEGGTPVYLPLDSKFPQEDYARLVEAQERGDAAAVEIAFKQLEVQIKKCAFDISTKYLDPPNTTDFAILFLPTEGLFAEIVRRSELVETLQSKFRVLVAGPTTLAAILNSLQMGFRTLAIQKRSSEVWNVLGAVKTEFAKYGDMLDKVKKKLDEARNTVDSAAVRGRAIERRLKGVESLPESETKQVLPLEDIVEFEALPLPEVEVPSTE